MKFNLLVENILNATSKWNQETSERMIEDAKNFVRQNKELFFNHDFRYILNNQRSLREFLRLKQVPVSILEFIDTIGVYQSNHYGDFNDEMLYNEYKKLPIRLKRLLRPDIKEIRNAYRGDSDKNQKYVYSFGTKNVAKFFGYNQYSLRDLIGIEGMVSTDKVKYALERMFGIKTSDAILRFFNVGDDESEILVFGGKWK
jgi:hypothetical protein